MRDFPKEILGQVGGSSESFGPIAEFVVSSQLLGRNMQTKPLQ